MATPARQALVTASEREVGSVVIKAPPGPTVRVMTLLAGLAEGLLMFVIVLVATDTGCVLGFIRAIGVAALAIGQSMQAIQGHTGEVVVEADVFEPSTGFVALLALVAEFGLVNVITAVAIDTAPHFGIRLDAIGVAAVATGLLVRAV